MIFRSCYSFNSLYDVWLEREENILFNLIVDNLGKNILDVDYPQKHIWFLLELYLRYRNRTIAGESQNVHLAVKDKLKKEGVHLN